MMKKPETRNSLKSLKHSNRKIVLNYMRDAGAVSVNQISSGAGLSKMTVHKIIDHYLEDGMVVPAGKGLSTEEGGKKPNLFAFNANCRYIFAVRIAGEFLSTSIVNLHGGTIAGSEQVSIVGASFQQVMTTIGDVFAHRVEENRLPKENCYATVVGCYGVVDTDKGICLTSYQYPGWDGNMPVRDCLEEILPENISVHVDSLARHMAHSEVYAAREAGLNGSRKNFFLIGNSGDCISGGMVVNGHAFRGATGFAGEIGHMIVDPRSEETCICGGRGCLEVLVVPGKMLDKAKARFHEYPNSIIFDGRGTGEIESFCVIGEAADEGDELARLLLDEAAGHFAVAINNIVIVSDPGRIVFFGDYARCGQYFMNELRRRVAALTMRGVDKRTDIEVSDLEDRLGVVGAANHIADRLFED